MKGYFLTLSYFIHKFPWPLNEIIIIINFILYSAFQKYLKALHKYRNIIKHRNLERQKALIEQMTFCCEIFTDFYKVNIRITMILLVLGIIFQEQDQTTLVNMIMCCKYDHQAFREGLFVHPSLIIVLHLGLCKD